MIQDPNTGEIRYKTVTQKQIMNPMTGQMENQDVNESLSESFLEEVELDGHLNMEPPTVTTIDPRTN